jgi:tRNA 2-thiocytidine biosynthesis protein TtcA
MLNLKDDLPIAEPPWTKLGRRIESLCRKALYDFSLVEGVDTLGVALSGGKDSLTLLYMLHAISGRGFPLFKLHAFHVSGEFSCGPGITEGYIKNICQKLNIPFTSCLSTQKRETLECYSCSRERRRLIFNAAKEEGISTIAFGHHRDDSIQTLLMNLLHKAEFAANLPKVDMFDYGVTIARPLIYVSEEEIVEFAKLHGFARIMCQCPVGQNSLRKKTKELIAAIEEVFPNTRANLSLASLQYGSEKAKKP